MRLSRTVVYGLRATAQLASAAPGTRLSCSELSRTGQMPERFLLQILRRLVAGGILQSSRGVDGGYCLSRPAGQVTVGDIVQALDDSLEADFPFADQFMPSARARLTTALQNAARAASGELHKLSMTDLGVIEAHPDAKFVSFPIDPVPPLPGNANSLLS